MGDISFEYVLSEDILLEDVSFRGHIIWGHFECPFNKLDIGKGQFDWCPLYNYFLCKQNLCKISLAH